MKIFIRLIMLVVVLGLAGPFFLKRPDGQPWMNTSDLMPNTSPVERLLTDIKAMFAGWFGEEQVEPIGQTKVYRWKSPEGHWQLSDTPPPDAKADVIFVNPDTNLIQGLRSTPVSNAAGDETANELPSGIPLPMTISPTQVKKLMDDAKAVQQTLNQRNQDLEAIVSGRARDNEQ